MGKNEFSCSYKRNGNGEIVILVHGALADERMWEEHTNLLNNSYDIISITLRHFGKSKLVQEGGFGLNTHSDDLANFIAELKTDKKVHLAGWSYGADVALNTVSKYPQLCSSAFLYEPGYPGYLKEDEKQIFVKDANLMFEHVFAKVNDGDLNEAVRVLIDGSGNKYGYFDLQHEKAKQQQLDNSHTLPKQLNQNEIPELTPASLPNISIPMTVAYGENTRPLFKVVSQSAAKIIPFVREVCVSKANHMLPIENPLLFSNLIRRHIENRNI